MDLFNYRKVYWIRVSWFYVISKSTDEIIILCRSSQQFDRSNARRVAVGVQQEHCEWGILSTLLCELKMVFALGVSI